MVNIKKDLDAPLKKKTSYHHRTCRYLDVAITVYMNF